ncbi:hypothetical protein MRX96_008190 [Rhipicephalus microplus]
MQVWALCVVTIGTFIMPVGLLILSYSNTPPAVSSTLRTASNPVASLNTSLSTSLTTSLTTSLSTSLTTSLSTSLTTSLTTSPATSRTTSRPTSTSPRTWPPLPSKCTESPPLNKSTDNLVFSQSRRFNVEPNNTIFCVYNVSRFRSLPGAPQQAYVPQNMPFGYCRSIVYWSMGVGADKIESRAEEFDHTYGAAMLRQLVTPAQGPKTILLAIGGYQSDSVHLTKIARHQRQLESFAKSVFEKVTLFRMDGVAVHWVPLEAACRVPGRDNDLLTVSTILDAITKEFLDRAVKVVTGLLLPADNAATFTLVNVLVNVVDYVIVQTHLLPLPPAPSPTLCMDVARSSANFIQSLSLSAEQQKKTLAWTAFVLGGQLRDLCGHKTPPCLSVSSYIDCIVVNPSDETQNMFMFPKSEALQSIVLHELINRPVRRVPSDRCAALFDLDMDNWDEKWTCKGFQLPYRYLTHFHASMQGYSSPMGLLERC